MDSCKVLAAFQGQVKTCRGDRQSQWKSGCVRVYGLDDGGLSAVMYLNVMPSQVYSQCSVSPSGVSVKSNRVVVEDAKGPAMYVRLSGSRDVEDSRRAISQLASHEGPKRNKAEVGCHTGLKSIVTPLKSPSTSSVSWTKITTPKSVTKAGESTSSTTPNVRATNRPKRSSLEMDDGDIDRLYNDENQDKATEYTRFRKLSPHTDSKEPIKVHNLKTNSFYGKNALMSPGLHIKSPRSRIREQQSLSSAVKGLYSSSMLPAVEESPGKPGDIANPVVVFPVENNSNNNSSFNNTANKSLGTETDEMNSSASSIVGFDNLGNTCFINSPLQCLAYLEPLSLDIQEVVQKYGKWLKQGSIIRLLYLLMKDVRKSGGSANPDRVKRILMRLRKIMDGKFAANTQQDAHELLSEILDRCHEEVQDLMKLDDEGESDSGGSGGSSDVVDGGGSECPRIKVPRPLNGLSKYIRSPTESNFSWFFKNSFQMQGCKNHSMTQEEHDTTIMLALTSHPELHLQDCLDNYFKGCEIDSVKCEACNQTEKATMTRKIVRRPRCLILNLLRYSTDNMDAMKKLDRVTIPRYISIGDFCTDDAKPPLYTTPAFLADRILDGDTSDPTCVTQVSQPSPPSLPTDKNYTGTGGAQKRTAEGIFTSLTSTSKSPPPAVKSNGNESWAQVAANNAALDSFDERTIDDDSVFGNSTSNIDNTTASVNTTSTSTATSVSTLSSLSSEGISTEGAKDKEINNNQDDKNKESCENNDIDNADEENGDNGDDNGISLSSKTCPLKQEKFKERVKCRGGTPKDTESNSNEDGNSNLSIEVEIVEEVVKGGGMVKTDAVDDGNGEDDGIGDEVDTDDDGNDFVPVGQVEEVVRCRRRIEDNDINDNEDVVTMKPISISISPSDKEISFKKALPLTIEEEEIMDDVYPMGQKVESRSSNDNHNNGDVHVKEKGEISGSGDGNNNVFKEPIDLEEQALMEADDMGNQMIRGRNVHEYSEYELQALDIEALTEYEMIVYAQALSRFEYEKEKRGREIEERMKKKRFEHLDSFGNMSDDFVYDESFLEEAESLLKTPSYLPVNYSECVEVSASPLKKYQSKRSGEKCSGDGEEESGSGSTGVSSIDGSLAVGAAADNSSGGETQKVPDILESGVVNDADIGLLCYENLSGDEEVNNMGGLKVTCNSSSSSSFSDEILGGGVLNLNNNKKRKKKMVTSGVSGLETFMMPQNSVSSGILSDKKQRECSTSMSPNTNNIVTNKDLKEALALSTKIYTLKDHQGRKVVNNSPNSSSDSDKDIPPLVMGAQSPSSYFPKPALDLCIVSPSKNRNLVKTRDYSRLRSPSASPKKKAAKSSSSSPSPSPMKKGSASKQLRFSDDKKECTPHKSNLFINSVTPEFNENDLLPNFDKKEINSSSRALIFGQDEPDAMHCNNNDNHPFNRISKSRFMPFFQSSSSSTTSAPTVSVFSAINTSTPILSSTTTCKSIPTPSPNYHNSSNSTSNHKVKSESSNFMASSNTNHDDMVISTMDGDGGHENKRMPSVKRINNSVTATDTETPFGPAAEPKYGACAPVQEGSCRRKINRMLTLSFSAAEGKENSVEINNEKQARRKRISNIEQGEADCSYRLVGIVNHHGESLFSGHYTCSSYNLHKQRWYHMDDRHTRETTEASVRKDSSTTGYVFFYMDKDLYESYAREKVRMSQSSSNKSSAVNGFIPD